MFYGRAFAFGTCGHGDLVCVCLGDNICFLSCRQGVSCTLQTSITKTKYELPFVSISAILPCYEQQGPLVVGQLQQTVVTNFQLRWWYSVELLRRLLLVLFAVAFPGNQASSLSVFL